MINVGSVNDKIMGKTKYIASYLEPDETQTIKVMTNAENMFVNGLRLLTPHYKVAELKKLEFQKIINSSNIRFNILNEIATYNIDRSKDKSVIDYNFLESDIETINLNPDELLKYQYKIPAIKQGQLYLKPYLIAPDEFEINLKCEKSIRFKYRFNIPLGCIVFENHEKLMTFYIISTDHFNERIDLYDEIMFDLKQYSVIDHDEYEFNLKYDKNIFTLDLKLYKEEAEVYSETKEIDATFTIFNNEVFTFDSYFENPFEQASGLNFNMRCSSLLMYEDDSLGSLITPSYSGRLDQVSFKIDQENLSKYYRPKYTNIVFNSANRSINPEKMNMRIKYPHILIDNKLEFTGIEYYLYSHSSYFTKADFAIEEYDFNNLRSMVIKSIDLIDVDSKELLDHKISYNLTMSNVEVEMKNKTDRKMHFLFNRSSKAGILQDLNQTDNRFVRVNDSARHIMSSFRYEPTSFKFAGISLLISESKNANISSIIGSTTYDYWNSKIINDSRFIVNEEDFEAIFHTISRTEFEVKGLIKPLNLMFNIPDNYGLFIYGYQIIMEHNGIDVPFAQVTFENVQILNAYQYIPIQIKIQLHGGL